MKKLNNILLIDDNNITNFLHKRVIEKLGIAESIVEFDDALNALEYLENNAEAKADLIFLDINMPGLDGWEFMERYNMLPEYKKTSTIYMLLSTMIKDSDAAYSKTIPHLSGFKYKPLSEEILNEIIEKHFVSVLEKE